MERWGSRGLKFKIFKWIDGHEEFGDEAFYDCRNFMIDEEEEVSAMRLCF
jgi:hypothetical protein